MKITSYDYILVVGCAEDDILIPILGKRVHKQKIGIIVVIADIISVLYMALIFSKLTNINHEYLTIMDDLRVQMKDFGVKLNNVKLDRYT